MNGHQSFGQKVKLFTEWSIDLLQILRGYRIVILVLNYVEIAFSTKDIYNLFDKRSSYASLLQFIKNLKAANLSKPS